MVYMFKLTNDFKLNQLDNIILGAGTIFTFSQNNKLYINFSPQKGNKSNFFEINKNNQIFPYKELPYKLIDGLGTNDTFVGLTSESLRVYCNFELDCYGSIKLEYEKLNSFHLIRVPFSKFENLILNLKGKGENTLRIITIERTNITSSVHHSKSKQKHFGEVISNLQSLMLKMKIRLGNYKDEINMLRPKNITRISEKLHLNNSIIDNIKIVSRTLCKPSDLWKKVESLQYEFLNFKSQFKISRQKRFLNNKNKLSVGKLKIFTINFNKTIYISVLKINNVNVHTLDIEYLKELPWIEYISGLANNETVIKGALKFMSPVNVRNLKTGKLNNLNTRKIFNFMENQNVTSNFIITKGLFSSVINCSKINGLDVGNDISKIEELNIIKCE